MDQLNEIKELVDVFQNLCRFSTNKTNMNINEKFEHVYGYYVFPIDLNEDLKATIIAEYKLLKVCYNEYNNTYDNYLQLKDKCTKFHDLFVTNEQIVLFYDNLPRQFAPQQLCNQWKKEIDMHYNSM